MSLFLPILLLGFAQPTDQPVAPLTAPLQAQAQIQNSAPSSTPSQDRSGNRSLRRFDPIEIYPSASSDVCFTMRSYYFTPQDDRALKPDGMTTCESGSDIAKRNAKKDHNPRLVPLTVPAK